MSRSWRQILRVVPLALALTGCNRVDFSGDRRQAVEDHLARAKKRYEQRDYPGAIAAYEEILRVDPQHSSSLFQIALIYDRNLNDYLNAAYHYQRFLKSPNPEAVKVELARGFLENTKLQFAASVPNASGQNSPELVKLRTENAALHRQVEELKREIVRGRSKSAEAPRATDSKPAQSSVSAPIPDKKTPARSRTYTVRKGEGIQAIAEKVYGDRRKWRDILSANPAIKDPDRLVPGQVLNLP